MERKVLKRLNETKFPIIGGDTKTKVQLEKELQHIRINMQYGKFYSNDSKYIPLFNNQNEEKLKNMGKNGLKNSRSMGKKA